MWKYQLRIKLWNPPVLGNLTLKCECQEHNCTAETNLLFAYLIISIIIGTQSISKQVISIWSHTNKTQTAQVELKFLKA